LADLLLVRSDPSSHQFYSLSAQIQKERKSYYESLKQSQRGTLDITSWIEWFLHCVEQAVQTSLSILDKVIYRAHFWKNIAHISLNERQRKVLNHLLGDFEDKLTSSKWAKLTKCSQDTAYRDILDLLHKNVLTKNLGEGRNTSYGLLTPSAIHPI